MAANSQRTRSNCPSPRRTCQPHRGRIVAAADRRRGVPANGGRRQPLRRRPGRPAHRRAHPGRIRPFVRSRGCLLLIRRGGLVAGTLRSADFGELPSTGSGPELAEGSRVELTAEAVCRGRVQAGQRRFSGVCWLRRLSRCQHCRRTFRLNRRNRTGGRMLRIFNGRVNKPIHLTSCQGLITITGRTLPHSCRRWTSRSKWLY